MKTMVQSYYTYRICIINRNSVRIEKFDPDNNNLGQPKGRFDYSHKSKIKNRIQELQQKASEDRITDSEIEELGEKLFTILFDKQLCRDFLSFYEEVRREKKALLRIELDIDEYQMPDVAALPFEFMRVPSDADYGRVWLGTDPNLIFSRRRARWIVPDPIQLKPGERLRIALVVAAPTKGKLGPVKYEKILNALQKLSKEQADKYESPQLVNLATTQSIDRILEWKPHVFHFIGHARLKDENKRDTGQIAMVDDILNEPKWIEAESFSELFNRHQPGIVILQACEGAALSASKTFVGVASQVVQQNIPVVVAMQYEISNHIVRRFVLEFYERLANNEPIDKAIQEGRRVISLRPGGFATRDFATPVLFMRVKDGHIFQHLPQVSDNSQHLDKSTLEQKINDEQFNKFSDFSQLTKVILPRIETQPIPLLYVRREKTIEYLIKSIDSSKTVTLVGPPGYGKSTLVTAIIKELKLPYIYYRFAPNEDIQICLMNLLHQLVSICDPNKIKDRLIQLEIEKILRILKTSGDIEKIIEIFVDIIQQILTSKILFILDDYHFIWESSSISLKNAYDDILRLLACQLPQIIRLIITSRKPIESLYNMPAIQQIIIKGFSKKETEQFLRMAYPDVNLSSRLIDLLQQRLEGWALGLSNLLQLAPASSSLEQIESAIDSLHGKQPLYEELLSQIVLDKLPLEDREFMKDTSVASELNGELCQKITGNPNAGLTLHRLAKQQSNFVFSFGGKKFWYRYHDLFRRFLRQKLSIDPGRECRALIKASEYYISEGLWQQAISCKIEAREYEASFCLLLDHGEEFYQIAQYEILLNWIDILLNEYKDNLHSTAWLYFMQGRILERRGRREEAYKLVNKSVEIYKKVGDLSGHAKSINKLGTIKLRLRCYFEAKEHFLESYRIRVDINDIIGQAQALYSLGDVYWHIGKFQEARTYLQESLELNRKLGHKQGIAIVEVMLGKLDKAEGRLESAHSFFTDALHLNEELNDVFGIVIAQSFIGEVALLRGELDTALNHFQIALRSDYEMGNKLGVAIDSKLIGEALVLQREFKEAEEYFKKTLDYNEKMHDQRGKAMVNATRSLIPRHNGDIDQAILMVKEVARLARETSDNLVLANSLIALGELQAIKSNFIASQEALKEAKKALNNINGAWPHALLCRAEGILQRQQKDTNNSITNLKNALAHFQKMGAKYETARTQLEIAETYMIIDNKVEARDYLESAKCLVEKHKFKYLEKKCQLIREQL